VLIVDEIHSYYDTAHVLQGASLQVGDGEVVGLLGRNGMGKTSMVRSIMGIRPPDLRDGTVLYNDLDITTLPSYEVSRLGIGYVPQGRHIFGTLSVEENLTVAARPGADGDQWNTDAVYDLFPRLGERRASRGTTLSGGEQQMLAVGRALMTNPRLILMDEPSEGLAPVILAQMRERLQELAATGLSILLVEQNLGLALALCERICVLGAGGRIVWQGLPAELDGDAGLKAQHLGV
jgi:branched-chain amino acid transport system ATP-binding protein